MDNFEIVLGLLTLVFGILTLHYAGKYRQFKKVLRLFVDMIEDDKITEDELKKFVDELKKLYSELIVEPDEDDEK